MDVTQNYNHNTRPGSIFTRHWWLDAVAPNAWDEVRIEENGKIVARLPYVARKRFGFTFIEMPPLTPALGIWFAPQDPNSKYVTRLSKQHKLIDDLISQLPRFDYFDQQFHYFFTNHLPFYWRGFNQTTRYTYVLNQLDDLDAIWGGMRENIRREIRKAKKQLFVRDDLELDIFLDLRDKTFDRQGVSSRSSRSFVARLDQACQDHKCRKIFFAEDSQGKVHAAVYLVWDESTTYYLMGGADPGLRNSGASSFLMWEAIKFAANVTPTFDFEGSMMQPVERFFRAFGAKQTPYFRITKSNNPVPALWITGRDWWRRSRMIHADAWWLKSAVAGLEWWRAKRRK